MTNNRHPRGIELSLLIPVLLVTLIGLALVFNGKAATVQLPPGTININTASARQFADALQINSKVAKAVVEDRTRRGGHFETVYDMRRSKALKGIVTAPIDRRFIARTTDQITRLFWLGVVGYLIGFLAVHIILRKAAPDADPFLLPLVALLTGVGLIMLYTVQDPLRDTFVFGRQVWGMARFGLIALLVPQLRAFKRLPLRRYQYLYALAAIVLLVLLKIAGSGPGDIHITILGVEPVEFIKVLLVFFIAAFITERQGLAGSPTRSLPKLRDIAPLLIIYAATLLMFQVLKDLGPAVLLFGTLVLVLYLVTGSAMYPAAGAIMMAVAGFAGYHMHLGFFVTRVTMWQNPWDNHDPKGIQLGQALWGMATGGFGGTGLGLGEPDFMSRSGSDLIFATIGEELGYVGAVIVLLVYALVIVRGFQIAKHAGTAFDRTLAAGLTVLFGLQTMIIVGGVTGLIPLTGITLPFISFGSSSLVANFFAVGMLLQISSKKVPAEAADQPSPSFVRASRLCVVCSVVYLMGFICLGPLLKTQILQQRETATRPIVVPDGDGVSRPHQNPRLTAFARSIPRGAILDRNKTVLARDAGEQIGVPYLTPDGRSRTYTGGPAFGALMYAIESPEGPSNLLGMNRTLRGYDSISSLFEIYRSRYNFGYKPPRGQDVVLTIDSKLQQTAYEALITTAAKFRDARTHKPKEKGAAAAVDVATGEVLASASSPGFDPSTLTADDWQKMGKDDDHRGVLLDRSMKGFYPPGSTFKIVTAAAALQYGKGNVVVNCAHVDNHLLWQFNGPHSRRVTDERGFVPHGSTDLEKALAVSCNVYFAHMGVDLGPRVLEDEARNAFQLPYFPDLATLGNSLADCAYGQGEVLVTPIEMARVAEAVANNGTMEPLVFTKFPQRSSTGTISHPLSPENAAHLQQMLLGVTTHGTAAGVFDGLSQSVAGKTGSAENNQGDSAAHSWFAGFAPASNPSIAFAAIIENGGYGRGAAAPVCRAIVHEAL